jgi:hypothetical protein
MLTVHMWRKTSIAARYMGYLTPGGVFGARFFGSKDVV